MSMEQFKKLKMRKINIYRFMAFLFSASIIFASCTKETSDVRLDPTLSTSQTFGITSNSATVVGFVIAEGDGFTERGVCYNTDTAPTIENNKVIYEGDAPTATFNVTLYELERTTKYYARAYATSKTGTIYGEEVTFTTLLADPPTLTTDAISKITGNSATGGGYVTYNGGDDVTARGVCYATNTNPTIDDDKTSDGAGDGAFVSSLTKLKGNTTYFIRAYASNSVSTGYGPEVSFTTLVDLPTVTTTAVTEIAKTTAVSGGEVTADGGAEITARGLVWSTITDPTLDDNVIDGATGTGVFVSNLTELEKFTTYHVRAFATNSAGTAYGEDIQFTTLTDITTMWVVGSYNGWDNSDNAKIIQSTATGDGTAEGYVYLTGDGFKLVTDHSWLPPATFGDDGSGNLTNPGNNIPVSADGYYLIKANLGTMTYSLTNTTWGIIGDATPSGWGDETALSYDPISSTWRGVQTLTAAQFKFRANHDWGLNYGSDAADGNLSADGANIVVDVESDYSITLDLSHPNEYTYSYNRWGLIGDATPGGWDDDTNMAWDVANNVFSITIDMTVGEFKFRANDGWDLNYGGSLDALEVGGGNVAIAADGNYTITFDPWGLTATVTKN